MCGVVEVVRPQQLDQLGRHGVGRANAVVVEIANPVDVGVAELVAVALERALPGLEPLRSTEVVVAPGAELPLEGRRRVVGRVHLVGVEEQEEGTRVAVRRVEVAPQALEHEAHPRVLVPAVVQVLLEVVEAAVEAVAPSDEAAVRERGGAVATRLEDLGQCGHAVGEAQRRLRLPVVHAVVARDAELGRVERGQEREVARQRGRGLRERLVETDRLGRDGVDDGAGGSRVAVAREVPGAERVEREQHDRRASGVAAAGGQHEQAREREPG